MVVKQRIARAALFDCTSRGPPIVTKLLYDDPPEVHANGGHVRRRHDWRDRAGAR